MSFDRIKPASEWPNRARYQKIPAVNERTGISRYALRKGCRNKTIPCIQPGGPGTAYLIDEPLYLEQLRDQYCPNS